MIENETKAYLLTSEQIDDEARRILANIKDNEFPQMRLKNNGVHRDISEEEFEISSQLIYNR